MLLELIVNSGLRVQLKRLDEGGRRDGGSVERWSCGGIGGEGEASFL